MNTYNNIEELGMVIVFSEAVLLGLFYPVYNTVFVLLH